MLGTKTGIHKIDQPDISIKAFQIKFKLCFGSSFMYIFCGLLVQAALT